ncbi:MAG: hypothetical protein V1676_02965 [Candidatus Diapherotrites archaeon]
MVAGNGKNKKNVVTMVAIDTNMLAAAEQFGVDVFEGGRNMFGNVEFVVPEQVLAELDKLADRGAKEHKAVEVAKKILAREGTRVKVISAGRGKGTGAEPRDAGLKTAAGRTGAVGADEALLELSRKGFIIATNDKELRARARKNGGKVLLIRKKSFLELE